MDFDSIRGPTECRLIMAVADLSDFHKVIREQSSAETFAMLEDFFRFVGTIVRKAGGKVVKCIGDAALMVFAEESATETVRALRTLKADGDTWWSHYCDGGKLIIKAHIGTVVCGPLGPADDKRFDIIGVPVVEMFKLPEDGFVLSGPLQDALAGMSREG